MNRDSRRITLVTRDTASPEREWNLDSDAPACVITLDAYTVLRYALQSGLGELAQDVERVIVDRSNTAGQFLDLLSSLPANFSGDAVLIRYDESAFLSALGRGGDRVLYALSPDDLRVHLEMHGLVTTDRAELLMTA